MSAAYVRRALECLGAAIDPAENHFDVDVEVARIDAAINATLVKLEHLGAALLLGPGPVQVGQEVWFGFDGPRNSEGSIAVVEKRAERYFLDWWVADSDDPSAGGDSR